MARMDWMSTDNFLYKDPPMGIPRYTARSLMYDSGKLQKHFLAAMVSKGVGPPFAMAAMPLGALCAWPSIP
eukprot:387131-Lingulodinium_polyedra.AAC.1